MYVEKAFLLISLPMYLIDTIYSKREKLIENIDYIQIQLGIQISYQ